THNQIALDHRALEAFGVHEMRPKVNPASQRLAGEVAVELDVTKLCIHKLPTRAFRLLHKSRPLFAGPFNSVARGWIDLNFVPDLLWRTEFAHDDFANRQRRQDPQLVGHGIDGIPPRLENPSTFLSEQFLGPN